MDTNSWGRRTLSLWMDTKQLASLLPSRDAETARALTTPADDSATTLPGPFVDQGSAADRSGDAGGEEAEVVGEGAVGIVGDACAQDGDSLGR